MDDKYYLRKANIDELDLSKYEGDFSPEELSAVKQTLAEQQKQHQESFDKLPFTERAKYHAADAMSFVEQNPETFLAIPAAAALLGAGKVAKDVSPTVSEKSKQVFGSLRDLMSTKASDEGLLASQQADKAIKQAEMSAKEVTATQKPTGVDATTDIGKGFTANDKGLVEKSEQNKNLTQAAKESGASDVRKFTRDASGNIQYPEGMSPSGRAGAEAFAKQFPDLAKQLEGKGQFAILGAGSGDNSLYNTYGAQTRKDIIQEVNQGKLAGPHGGNEGFYNKTLTPAINAVPPTTALGAELERLRAVEPKGGTHGPLGTSVAIQEGKMIRGKNQVPGALKAGGPAALLMAIADAANAAEGGGAAAKQGDTQMARGYATDLAGALTGPLGMIASQVFGTSPEDLRVLRAAEQGRKVGGGRGIAPPSAYQR